MGLFERAAKTPPENPPLSEFQQWAEFQGFAHCGVFCASQKIMLLKHAHGIDCETILKSISTNDFWTGSAAGEKWILLERSDERFAGFLQFLGSDAKEKTERIAILRLRENPATIFFAYDSSEFQSIPNEEDFRRDLLLILENKKNFFFRAGDEKRISGLVGNAGAFLITISLDAALKEIFSGEEKDFLSENPKSKEILSNAIFKEFFFEAKKIFPWPDFVAAKNFSEINIVSILARKKNEENTRKKIFDTGKKIFTTALATKIEVDGFSRKRRTEEIISYILRG